MHNLGFTYPLTLVVIVIFPVRHERIYFPFFILKLRIILHISQKSSIFVPKTKN